MLGKYRAGFCDCINEVIRFMATHAGVDTQVKSRLLSHLASCVSHLDFISCHPQLHLRECSGMQHLNAPLFILPAEASKLHNSFHFVPSSDGTFGLLIPSSSSRPASSTGSHNGAPSSGGAQVNAQDSLWRPW